MMNIRNWKRFQHFNQFTKGRVKPPWIKLYREILDDSEWHALDGDAAKLLIMIFLLASENNGSIPDDKKKLAFRFRVSEVFVNKHLPSLSHWLCQGDITVISPGYQVDAQEERRGDREGDREDNTAPPELAGASIVYKGDILQITSEIHNSLMAVYDEGLCKEEYPKANLWLQNNPKKRRKNFGAFMANWLENAAKRTKGTGERTGALGLPFSQLGAHGQQQAAIGQDWLADHERKGGDNA